MYSERARGVSSHCPSPAAIQCGAFLHEDADKTATTEGFWVDLAFDFECVKREEDLLLSSLSYYQSQAGTLTTSPIPVKLSAEGISQLL
jgi:hypothetical protein